MNLKFDKKYWIFIGTSIFFHFIAILCTYHAISQQNAVECNGVSANLFSSIGFIESAILSTVIIFVVMIAVPFLNKQNEKIGLISAFTLSIAVILTGFDAFHDILVITGSSWSTITFVGISAISTGVGIPWNC